MIPFITFTFTILVAFQDSSIKHRSGGHWTIKILMQKCNRKLNPRVYMNDDDDYELLLITIRDFLWLQHVLASLPIERLNFTSNNEYCIWWKQRTFVMVRSTLQGSSLAAVLGQCMECPKIWREIPYLTKTIRKNPIPPKKEG